MARQTGSLIQYAISPEATAGTYLAPISGEWLPRGEGSSFNDSKEMVALKASRGDISSGLQRRISKKMGAGSIVTPLGNLNAGNVLMAIMGKNPVTTGASAPYSHAFTVLHDSNAHKSFTVVRLDEEGTERTFTYAMLNSAEISWSANGDPIMANMEWMSKPSDTEADVTPGYDNDELFFYPDMVTLELVDESASFSAPNMDVKSASISFNKNLQEIVKAGTPDVQGFIAGNFEVSGNLEIDKVDDTEFNKTFLNTDRKIKVVFTAGTSSLTITLGELTFDNPTLGTDLDGIETISRAFTVNKSATEVTATLVNTEAAYPMV